MSKQRLAEATDFLQRFDNASQLDVFTLRENIFNLLDSFYLDLNAVTVSLSQLGKASEYYTLLQLPHFSITHRIDVFLHTITPGATRASPPSNEERQAYAFTAWFLHVLLRLFTSKGCVALQSRCRSLIVALLDAIQIKSSFVFRQFTEEMILALGDLVEVNKSGMEEGSKEVKQFQVFPDLVLGSFTKPGSQTPVTAVVRECPLMVTDLESCELLETNLTLLLLSVVTKVCSVHTRAKINLLTSILTYQIEYGDPDLKVASEELLRRVMLEKGLPQGQVREYVLSLLPPLVELVVAKCHGMEPEDCVRMEVATASLLEALVTADGYALPGDHLSQTQREQFLDRLKGALGTGDMSSLTERAGGLMRAAVSRLVACLVGKLAMWKEPRLDTRTCLVTALFHGVGVLTELEFLVPLTARLISLELEELGPVGTVAAQSKPPARQAVKRSHRRLAKTATAALVENRRATPFYDLLLQQVKKVLLNPPEDGGLRKLAALWLLVEVSVRSVVKPGSSQVAGSVTELVISRSVLRLVLASWWDWLNRCAGITRSSEAAGETASADFQIGELTFQKGMQLLLGGIGALVCAPEGIGAGPELWAELTTFLSLPWIAQGQEHWQDLHPPLPGQVEGMSTTLRPRIGSAVRVRCLEILALLPASAPILWRHHVFTQALTDGAEEVRIAAVVAFPHLLYQLGSPAHSLIPTCLRSLVEDNSPAVVASLAESLQRLVCVLSGQASLCWVNILEKTTPLHKNVLIHCSACTNYKAAGSKPGRDTAVKVADSDLFNDFFPLLQSQNAQVRKAMVGSLWCMLGHLEVGADSDSSARVLEACLSATEDSDYFLRMQAGQALQRVVATRQGSQTPGISDVEQAMLTRLCTIAQRARSEKNTRLQETAIYSLGQLSRVAEGELLMLSVSGLLEGLLTATPTVHSMAYLQIQDVAAAKNMSVQVFFKKHRGNICKVLVEALLEQRPPLNSEEIVQRVGHVFGTDDPKAFLQTCERFVLPLLISKGTSESSVIIRTIASIQNVPNHRKMLIHNTKYIFSYLVRECPKEMARCIAYLQSETGFELGSLLRMDFERVHSELLLHLSQSYSQVFNGLKTLASYDDQCQGPRDVSSTEQMAEYLESRLLGVLAFFDSQLMNSNVEQRDKQMALGSLISIMELMGSKYITSIRHKVFNTLRLGLQFKDRTTMEISCRAWNCFVRSLEIPWLGTMLSQIAATLLPLLQSLPSAVAEIFNYMFLENREELESHFAEVYFLPEIPELAEVLSVLKQYTDAPSSHSDLNTRLVQAVQGIKHESQEVRVHALSKLRKLLREEKVEILKEVQADDSAPPIFSELVTVLLEGCREVGEAIRCLYAECLGELGAIDPGRLGLLSTTPRAEVARFQASLEDDNFAVGLISEVVKAFLAATEPRTQDCSAFALQELLRIYEIREDGEGGVPNSKLWRRFPEHVQEILNPLLTSKYVLTAAGIPSSMTKPIFGSRHGKSFKNWVSFWASYLITKVQQEHARSVFQACCVTLRHNVSVALYLLPHIILHVLQDADPSDVNEVVLEVLEALGAVHKPEPRHGSALDFRHMSAQTVFSALDHLTKWCRHRIQVCAAEANNPKDAAYLRDPAYVAVNGFLDRIPLDMVAEVSHTCQAFTRSLMHLEEHVTKNPTSLQTHLDLLQRLYVALDEVDGVLGVAAVRESKPTLAQEILTLESLGEHQDAQACYERAIQLQSSEVSLHCGLLRSLLELGQLTQVTSHATGVIVDRPAWSRQLNEYRVEAAWRLCSWDQLDKCVAMEKGTSSWPVQVGRLLLSARDRKEEEFLEQLHVARQGLMGPLSAASLENGSYYRGYEHILRLQLLTELEVGLSVLGDFPAPAVDSSQGMPLLRPSVLLAQWEQSLQVTQTSIRVQEPILTLRRTLVSLVGPDSRPELSSCLDQWWLGSAKIARKEGGTLADFEFEGRWRKKASGHVPKATKAGYLQTANACLIQACNSRLPQYFLEKAKWLWARGKHDEAVVCLKEGTEDHFGDGAEILADMAQSGQHRRQVYAQALLLYGRYCEEVSNMESNAIVKLYKDVIEASPNWEDSHFYLAKYYDKIMTTLIENRMPEKQGEFILQVVKFFGQSLQYGNAFIYQSMPRLLSLWLDHGTAVVEAEKKETRPRPSQHLQAQRVTLQKLNKVMSGLINDLAPYQFLTAMSQLISRICHAHPDVFQHLKELLARLLVRFPQQAAWMMMAVSKSSYPMRVKRCQEIFALAKTRSPELHKFLNDITKLTDQLLELCDRNLKDTSPLSLATHFRSLKRLMEGPDFSSIILPLQSAMTVSLPSSLGPVANHRPFPHTQVFIRGIQDTIEILPSLQKPRKITIEGSDGHLYVMMCKPKDDLRKDCRLMEFNTIVNKFLRKDPESRRRDLHIRTYSVIPLNEECGLIEWVNNTSGLRHILMRLYKERGLFTTGKELKALMPTLQSSLQCKLQVYQKELLPRHPPLLQEWYHRTFPDPNSWYNARLAYARTLAVMSMVGYILGLGDRHGENILFDSTNGDCVHVDFNCLFNKGETFEWPERVPFRLTHNMVNALGSMRWEGVFRRASEVCLRVMRTRMDPLMSVLRPFIYDPLVEWGKPARNQRSIPTDFGEITNEQAMNHVQNIEHRLRGILKSKTKPRGLPLSIEGHVHHLIQEATDENNLCQMYIGWAAYL